MDPWGHKNTFLDKITQSMFMLKLNIRFNSANYQPTLGYFLNFFLTLVYLFLEFYLTCGKF